MDNSQQPHDTTSANAWFDEVAPPAPPSPPRHSWKKVLLVISGALITIGGIGSILVAVQSEQRTTCLTLEDYRTLTGTTLTEEISPTSNFYTNSVSFVTKSTSYDDMTDNGIRGKQLVQKIASFYDSHEQTSVIITLTGNYYATELAELAQQRVDAIITTLTSSGVPVSAIQAPQPTYAQPEESIPQDGVTTTISMTSAAGCSTKE